MRKRRTTPRSNASRNSSISKQLAATLPEKQTESARKIQAISVEEQEPPVEQLSDSSSILVCNSGNHLSWQAPPKPSVSKAHSTFAASNSKVTTVLPHIVLNDLWIDILSFFAQVYLTLYEMTLGIGKWWAGTEIEDSHKGKERKVKEIKARRRRRRVESSSSSSGRFSFSFPFSSVGYMIRLRVRIDSATGRFFPGMVNLSGTLCYMNSVLQVGFMTSASHVLIGPCLTLLLVCCFHTLTHHSPRKCY